MRINIDGDTREFVVDCDHCDSNIVFQKNEIRERRSGVDYSLCYYIICPKCGRNVDTKYKQYFKGSRNVNEL